MTSQQQYTQEYIAQIQTQLYAISGELELIKSQIKEPKAPTNKAKTTCEIILKLTMAISNILEIENKKRNKGMSP